MCFLKGIVITQPCWAKENTGFVLAKAETQISNVIVCLIPFTAKSNFPYYRYEITEELKTTMNGLYYIV